MYVKSSNRDTDIKNKHMGTNGRTGKRNEFGDWDSHIYATKKKQVTNENRLHSTGNSTQCYVVTKRGCTSMYN